MSVTSDANGFPLTSIVKQVVAKLPTWIQDRRWLRRILSHPPVHMWTKNFERYPSSASRPWSPIWTIWCSEVNGDTYLRYFLLATIFTALAGLSNTQFASLGDAHRSASYLWQQGLLLRTATQENRRTILACTQGYIFENESCVIFGHKLSGTWSHLRLWLLGTCCQGAFLIHDKHHTRAELLRIK